MLVKYLVIGSMRFLISAYPEVSDSFDSTFENALWGTYNDGLNWTATNASGEVFTKSGNRLTITRDGTEIYRTSLYSTGDYYGFFALDPEHPNNLIIYKTNGKQGQTHQVSQLKNGWYATSYQTSYIRNFIESHLSDSDAFGAALFPAGTRSLILSFKYNSDAHRADLHRPSFPSIFLYSNITYHGNSVEINQLVTEDEEVYYDPYSQGGTSGEGGGEGTFDGTSDGVDFPSVPTTTVADCGFINLFNPTLAQLRSLASYMWTSTLFDINNLKKLYSDPMDCILGLTMLPVAIPNSGTAEVYVGNLGTGIHMNKATAQFVSVDCGSVTISEYWGAYLDYAPYTKIDLYLPYVGIQTLDTDTVMGKTITVKYVVDILTGSAVAMVKCGDSVLYSYTGNCATQMPVTSTNYASYFASTMSIAGTAAAAVATGGVSALATPEVIGATATNANGLKPEIKKSGSLAGNSGYLGIQKPYVIITRPRQCLPVNQNTYMGYPSYITKKLSDLTGYTEIEEIHLENLSCTESEAIELENMLKSGVIF